MTLLLLATAENDPDSIAAFFRATLASSNASAASLAFSSSSAAAAAAAAAAACSFSRRSLALWAVREKRSEVLVEDGLGLLDFPLLLLLLLLLLLEAPPLAMVIKGGK
jgi:hypothetical protein